MDHKRIMQALAEIERAMMQPVQTEPVRGGYRLSPGQLIISGALYNCQRLLGELLAEPETKSKPDKPIARIIRDALDETENESVVTVKQVEALADELINAISKEGHDVT